LKIKKGAEYSNILPEISYPGQKSVVVKTSPNITKKLAIIRAIIEKSS
jgi:hypothetical protein